jgi:hypothetical protein
MSFVQALQAQAQIDPMEAISNDLSALGDVIAELRT